MVAVQNIKNVFKLYRRQHNNYVARRRKILAAITLKSQKHKQLFKKWRNLLKHKTKLFLTCNLSNLSFTVNFPKIFRRTSSAAASLVTIHLYQKDESLHRYISRSFLGSFLMIHLRLQTAMMQKYFLWLLPYYSNTNCKIYILIYYKSLFQS